MILMTRTLHIIILSDSDVSVVCNVVLSDRLRLSDCQCECVCVLCVCLFVCVCVGVCAGVRNVIMSADNNWPLAGGGDVSSATLSMDHSTSSSSALYQ